MAFTDRKLETGILVLSVVLFGGLGYVLKTPVQSAILGQDVVYEMPRIKKSFLASLFDLGDREIERTYKNPFAKKQAAEKKKAEEAKKAQAAAAAAKATAQIAAKKAVAVKKPTVEINTVQAVPAKQWADDTNPTYTGRGGQNYYGNGGNSGGEATDDKGTMSRDQWRALLMAQPTAENVGKLVAAFSKEEVDAETFYVIVEDLFKANKSETQTLGLMAAKSFYNSRSFILTTQYMDQFTTELQDDARTYLMSYGVSSRLGILASILKGSDAEAVTMAAQAVVAGYQSAKSGTPLSTDPRNSRGDVVTNSLGGYSQFIPIFQDLATHQDSVIASVASEALSRMQNNVAAL